MGSQESWWTIPVAGSVIVVSAVLVLSSGQTDRQTHTHRQTRMIALPRDSHQQHTQWFFVLSSRRIIGYLYTGNISAYCLFICLFDRIARCAMCECKIIESLCGVDCVWCLLPIIDQIEIRVWYVLAGARGASEWRHVCGLCWLQRLRYRCWRFGDRQEPHDGHFSATHHLTTGTRPARPHSVRRRRPLTFTVWL